MDFQLGCVHKLESMQNIAIVAAPLPFLDCYHTGKFEMISVVSRKQK